MLFLLFIFHIRICKFWFSNYCFILVYFLGEDTHEANEIQHKISKSVFVTLTMNGVFHSLVRSFAYIRVRSILERKHTCIWISMYLIVLHLPTTSTLTIATSSVVTTTFFIYSTPKYSPFAFRLRHSTEHHQFSLLIIQSSSAK